jgi:DnaK suppressor protein
MKPETRERFRQTLLEMRDRVANQAGHVAESIREDIRPPADASAAPVHLADIATAAADADEKILLTEQDILSQVDAAIHRIDEGTYGICETCEKRIDEERLRAIPYAALCVHCAAVRDQEGVPS